MEKSKLLWLLGILEGVFYLLALAWTAGLWNLSSKLNMPVMLPFRPMLRRLAACSSALVFCGLMVIVFLFNRELWQVLVLGLTLVIGTFGYFLYRLKDDWKAIQRASDLNELRFVDSQKFRAIVEATQNGVISFNSNGRIIDWNPAAETMFYLKEAEVVGKDISQFFEHNQSKLYLEKPGTVLRTCGIRADGEKFPVEIYLSSYIFDKEIRFTVLVKPL